MLFLMQEDGLTEDYTSSPLHRFKVRSRDLPFKGRSEKNYMQQWWWWGGGGEGSCWSELL